MRLRSAWKNTSVPAPAAIANATRNCPFVSVVTGRKGTASAGAAAFLSVMPYRYRLIDAQGTDLGPFVSNDDEWAPGSTIARSAGDVLRVVAVVEPEDTRDFRAYLVVEQAA
jgi:hypothetical protein